MTPAVPRGTNAWFVTGTDTDVGKTWVACKLLEQWRTMGLAVAGLKAAESGGGGDDAALVKAAGATQPERCAYWFEPAVAPGVAADDAGVFIDFERIRGQVDHLRASDAVLVEGAGGWMVPMGKGRTIADLAVTLGLPVIVVARATLGTINHSVLTVEAIERRGLVVAAVALNARPEDDTRLAERNRDEIASMVSSPVVLLRGGVAELVRALQGE